MITPGTKMDTSFPIEIVDGDEKRQVLFSELLDQPVVVSVYMRNNTGGCDRQNKSLAEKEKEIAEKGYKLVAISRDNCRSHKKYADKLGIGYILASDPEFHFAKATGSIVEKKMYGKTFEGPTRSAYFIDTDGTVEAVIEKINTARHGDELLETIEKLNSGI